MSIEVPVDVKLKNFDVPANLMLSGLFSSEVGFRENAKICLGGVDVLQTYDSHLAEDMKRFEKEIRDGTLSINYDWNASLFPAIEMIGERNSAIRKLRDSFRHKGHETSPGYELPDGVVLYTSVRNFEIGRGVSEMSIGRSHFNIYDSGFYVDVSCNLKPTNKRVDALNEAKIVDSSTNSWGSQLGGIGPFHYEIRFELPTRTEPSEISRSLSGTASKLIKVLNS